MSTLKTSPSLYNILLGASTKLERANRIAAALGNTRRLRAWRDANPAATDPATTGTEFLNVASTGDMTIVAGNIATLGVLSDATIHTGADLATGASVLRVEGNGHWVEGTLGLPGANTYFTMSASPTATSGIAVKPGEMITSPPDMPSGTGLPAPIIAASTPTIVELVDWRDQANPKVVGIARYTAASRISDWVYEHPMMADQIGDVAYYVLDNPINWDTGTVQDSFTLGGILAIAPNVNTEAGVQQLEQMGLSFAPYKRWATYPFMDTYTKAQYTYNGGWSTDNDPENNLNITGPNNPSTADLTYPPAFKINLYTEAGYAAGTPTFTHEMKAFNDKAAGPLNGPQWSQRLTKDEPVIPHFNCGMMLPWQNLRTSRSKNIDKLGMKVGAYAYNNPWAKAPWSANANQPLLGGGQLNALGNWFILPPYPLKAVYRIPVWWSPGQAPDVPYLDAYESTPKDPDMNHDRDVYSASRLMGWKYQPGSISGHDWRTGPGGLRFDRSVLPAVLQIWASDPNWVRPEGNVPIRDLLDGWGMAYFNHSNHWIKDFKTFKQFDDTLIDNGDGVFASAYYGGGPYGAAGQSMGPQDTIDLVGIGSGRNRWKLDLDVSGRLVWGGWQRDCLHSYCNAGLWAIATNSPLHSLLQVHDYNTQWFSGLGENARPTTAPLNYFTQRIQAWRWLSYLATWVNGAKHPAARSQADVANRFRIELEKMYDDLCKPIFIDNVQTPTFNCIRNLGTWGYWAAFADPPPYYSSKGGSLYLYMVDVLVMMKQMGFWDAMYNLNAKCKASMDMVINCLDKMTIDYCLDTDMRDCYYPCLAPMENPTAADIPANWAAQKVMIDTVYPSGGTGPNAPWFQSMVDWSLKSDGTHREHDGNPHKFLQYMKMRKIFFTEFPHARIDAAITKMETYYTRYADMVVQGKASRFYHFHPTNGEFLPPV